MAAAGESSATGSEDQGTAEKGREGVRLITIGNHRIYSAVVLWVMMLARVRKGA